MFKKPVIEEVDRPVGGSYPICGVTVKFPYKPYPQQIIFMQRVSFYQEYLVFYQEYLVFYQEYLVLYQEYLVFYQEYLVF